MLIAFTQENLALTPINLLAAQTIESLCSASVRIRFATCSFPDVAQAAGAVTIEHVLHAISLLEAAEERAPLALLEAHKTLLSGPAWSRICVPGLTLHCDLCNRRMPAWTCRISTTSLVICAFCQQLPDEEAHERYRERVWPL